jgi:DNA-directed RNA polymerase subunit RPC12/RpoP
MAEINDKPPSITKAPPEGRKFPCPSCGARLDFDPSVRGLACPYCGHREEITKDSKAQIVERDYLKYLDDQEVIAEPIPGHETQTRCTGCGAMVLLDSTIATDKCPFCATHLENKPVAVACMIAPEATLPFALDLRAARAAFTKWLEGLWFAPTELTKIATLGQLQGVYVPYWTYDAMTYTFYDGERGDNYTDYETYTVVDANGNRRTETRTVIRIRWWSVSGEVQHFFDDVLVCGSNSVPQPLIDDLEPWPLTKLEPFLPEYLSGFRTERYAVGLKEGFQVAKSLMEPEIEQLIHRDIGGDHQRIHDKKTKYSAITFKHLLLPMWIAVYRYHDRTFQIVVNGVTGRVTGYRPWSTFKIVRLVLMIAIVIGVLIFLIVKYGK